MALAESQARADRPAEAAAAYEKLIVQDPSRREAIAGILVKLYAKAGDSQKAIEWARVVMEHNPEPQAYLAGVHSLLGDHRESIRILEAQLQAPADAERAIPLYWQLADEYEALGEASNAERALATACEKAGGHFLEPAARERLVRFRDQAGASKAPGPQAGAP